MPILNLLSHPHPDTYLSFEEITINAGLHVEKHLVETLDGYINLVFRINDGKPKEKRPAVVMMHGLIDSSDAWIAAERNKSHAFTLADKGYDVWVVNTRGNKYSREHKWLDSDKDLAYWDKAYSLEIAKNDVPAFIEYAKKHS